MPSRSERRGRAAPAILMLCLGLAGCADSTDMLKDVRQVKATVYRHKLAVEPVHVEMPGERLGPATACGGATAPTGMFDPCRPDPDAPDRDAAGFPRYRWDVAAPAARPPQARAGRPATAAGKAAGGKVGARPAKLHALAAKPHVQGAKPHVQAVKPPARPAKPHVRAAKPHVPAAAAARGKASPARPGHVGRRAP